MPNTLQHPYVSTGAWQPPSGGPPYYSVGGWASGVPNAVPPSSSAPTVTAVAPAGTIKSRQAITVTGTQFDPVSTRVSIAQAGASGNFSCTNVNVLSATQLTCVTGIVDGKVSAGGWSLVVTTPHGTTSFGLTMAP